MNSWSFGISIHVICIIGVKTTDYSEKLYSDTGSENSRLPFMCFEGKSRLTEAVSPFPNTTSAKEVAIDQCDPTNTSYFAELQALNINASAVESLDLMFDTDIPLPQGNYTEGLLIKNLTLNNLKTYYEYVLQNVPNFLEPLTNLEYLTATCVQLPSLPKSAHVLALSLQLQATIKDWGNCRYLEKLEIVQFYDGPFPEWLLNCNKLKSLRINLVSEYKIDIVIKKLTPATHSLRTLEINNNLLRKFPMQMLTNAKTLIDLDLANNSLDSTEFPSLPQCNTIKTLDLSGNRVSMKDLKYLVPKLPRLRKLRLGSNYGVNALCESPNSFTPLQNWSTEYIQLMNVDFDLSCISGLHFTNLKEIEMTDQHRDTSYSTYDDVEEIPLNDIKLRLSDLPLTSAGKLKVVLEVKRLTNFLFDETDFKALRGEISYSSWNKHNLTVYNKHPISCDCEHGWLARALREFPNILSMPRLLCSHGENYSIPLLDEPLELLECDRTEDKYCSYRKSWRDGKVVAECLKNAWIQEELPEYLYGLNVSGRGINTLRSKLPDNLQWLDLRRNDISRGSAEEAAALFAAGRRVWLANNSLLCDCDNRAFLDAVQKYQNQVEDYNLLNCAGTDKAISSISTDVLCQTVVFVTTITLGVVGVLAVIAGMVLLLLRRFGEQLKMFLYSRGWFVSYLQKQDPDDKPYDAFLSFAHEDHEYVTETLLPGLENAPEQFRICVHYRDWPIGDWIPAQIMRSVQLSKRTLIVLSRNFVASAWSTLEFRYSLANTTEDPNAKVLVLIKDDVLDMDLDKDLRRYLTFNTYLRCDDPWFWEKLRYAMPHRLKKKPSEKEDADAAVTVAVVDMRAPTVLAVSDNEVYIVSNVE